MNIALPIGALIVLGVVWGMASVSRSKEIRRLRRARAQARTVLTSFARTAMGQNSQNHIVGLAGEVATKLFGAKGLYLISEDANGQATSVAVSDPVVPGDEVSFPPLDSAAPGGPIGWFPDNPAIVFKSDLTSGKNSEMSVRLGAMMSGSAVDVLLPLVHNRELLAIVGLAIGRTPSDLDRELLRIFKLEVTAACANVHLHHEVSHLHSLVDEVNVATGLDLSLIPKEMSGRVGKFAWHGHYRSAEQAGSDFWGMYPLSANRLLVVVGDSVGRRLSGAMVSASVKSCCDQVVADKGASLTPGDILSILNASLFRATHSALASCSVTILDPMRSQLTYANAGHLTPYRLRKNKDGLGLTVLPGTGPLLGDLMTPEFKVHREQLSNSDTVVFLTDGLLAPRDTQGSSFGYRRFHKLLKRQASTDPKAMKEAVLASINAHSADQKLRDDQALLIVKWA
jgi:serine phosphatase RsbU (regulator of sigma subunit)